jgi:hypothetical protein
MAKANIVRQQFNLQFGQGNASQNIFSTVQIASTADFLVHLYGTNTGPNSSWLGFVSVSSTQLNQLELVFNPAAKSGSQYLGCVGGNAGETLVVDGIVQLADGLQPMPMVVTVTVISDGIISVTPRD